MLDFLARAINDFAIVDLVDIAIVAFLVYKFILLIRDTRAMSLIKGIVALVLATIISEYLQLDTTHWLLSNIWTVGMLAAVVVFQPELRRALEQLGRGRILSPSFFPRTERDIEQVIDNVVKAVSILAKNKIGALIVIERETGIGDFMETGIHVDGLVASELLLNIFIPNTPLHDGAVMIRGDRIVAAACYLPLTSNPFLSTELGTRHRAAIGITEDSDALAVVVSEETGSVSLAEAGELQRHLDGQSLRELLHKAILTENSSSPFQIKIRRSSNDD